MSVAPNSLTRNSIDEADYFKMRLVTHVCENGDSFQYYDNVPGYSDADYADMISAVCD